MTRPRLYLALDSHENRPSSPQETSRWADLAVGFAVAYILGVAALCASLIAPAAPSWPCYTDAECEAQWQEVTPDPCAIFECEGGQPR